MPDTDVWLEWKHLTGPDIDAIPRERAVVIASVSPLEVHGPHLPTICDNLEAEGIARRTAELLKERHPELIFLHLPPYYVAADVLPHVGSVMFRSSTVARVMEDLGRSLAKQGFKRLWISNFHGGPRHFVPIEMAADRVNRRHGGEVVSLFGLLINKLTGGSTSLDQILGNIGGVRPEDLVGDSHGGAVETSMLLHLIGEHVRPVYRKLPRRTVDLKLAQQGKPPLEKRGERPTLGTLIRGFKHKIKYFEDETYAGTPSLATAELGAQYVDILSRHAADALEEVLDGRRTLENCRSPLWKLRWIFGTDVVGRVFERAIGYRNRVW